MSNSVVIGGAAGKLVEQLGVMSNRHGLITGATGTGKTVTLQV
ncbi:MAG TPA: helicase HerA-like domain-containing protein, partial [Pseudomonadales bacterium]